MKKDENEILCRTPEQIDLIEVLNTILKWKKFIFLFTLIATLIATIYAFLKTPTYQARAVVQVGHYKDIKGNKKLIDDVKSVVTELETLFLTPANEKSIDRIEDINILNKGRSKLFFEIVVNSINNDRASNKIKEVVNYIQTKHKRLLDFEKSKIERKIIFNKNQIKDIKDVKIGSLEKSITDLKKQIDFYNKTLYIKKKNRDKIEESSPALALLDLKEEESIINNINQIKENIYKLKDEKFKLEYVELKKLEENIKFLEDLLKPESFKNTAIVGDIILNDKPIKPKKKLIVGLTFVTSFLFSIFLIFLIEFIKEMRGELKESKNS